VSSRKIDLVVVSAAASCEYSCVGKKPESSAIAPHAPGGGKPVSLRELAGYLGLSPTTVSLVLNDSPGAEAISQATKSRVAAAARKFNYRPNFLARSLRAKRSYAVGVMVPELSEGYAALVVAGIEEVLVQRGYMCLATSHRHSDRQFSSVTRLLADRQVEGLILVDTPYPVPVPLPVVSVSGRLKEEGVTNIVLDHDCAANLGIGHLVELGHRSIAVVKGQAFSSDTEVRWKTIEQAARRHGVPIDPKLMVQLEGDSPSPETGYAAAQTLLQRGVEFTALFAFNDVSAFGAIRAFQERGLRVPEAVSVIGFDDIWGAAYHIPALTTIRQPLRRMGALAAETLIDRIESKLAGGPPQVVQVVPELVIRESTAAAARAAFNGQTAVESRVPAHRGGATL